MTIVFNWYGPRIPFQIFQVIPSYLGLRVIFNKPAVNDVGLRDPDNYQINVDVPNTSFDFGCVSVTPEDGAEFPTYVDLEMTDNTHGKGYELEIIVGSIKGAPNDPITLGNNTASFNGVSEMPEVLTARPLSLTTVRVTFTKIMSPNADVYDASKYVWTSGISTIKVSEETDSSVILTTTEQIPASIYELTVG